MVKVSLQVKCQLENLALFRPEGEDFRWYIKLKCANCGDETPDFVYLDLLNTQPLKGGRGSASLVLKCKLCSRENSIDIIKDSIHAYTSDDSNSFKSIITFDCRGVEPVKFSPRVGFLAEAAESGTVFKDVDLKDGEWADYDEKENQSVGIYEIEHQFIKA